ncbi:MAG: hypothetical protein ABJA66_01935 [Actinomycetota bacterium]
MNYQDNNFEKKAQAYVNQLKQEFVIDLLTGERLQEILVYLYLSQANKNPRGINIQQENLKDVLQKCPAKSRLFVSAAAR